MDKNKKARVWELDFLRGFSIIMMVFDHTMYDLKSLPMWFSNYFQVENEFMQSLRSFALLYWNSNLRAVGHLFFVGFFLLVSGISFNFSHSNLKRGTKFLIVAVIISLVSMGLEAIFEIRIGILFGIIHMFALGTLLTYLLRKIWNNEIFIFTVGALIIMYGISFQFLSVSYYDTLSFSRVIEVIIGTKGYGADHFGIAPYTGVIMIGSVIGNLFYKNQVSLLPFLDKAWNKPFVFAGQKSLIIFVTHQFVIISLVYLLGYILGYKI